MHLLKVKAVKSNQPITNYMANTSTQVSHGKAVKKGTEILWAAFVAEHNLPFTIMEHLPQAAAKAYPDSKIAADVACGRKKRQPSPNM
ncbi:unnamed protein product [Tenebrio molitor]|nr:unnamed protein product [Tenebrio molitor]